MFNDVTEAVPPDDTAIVTESGVIEMPWDGECRLRGFGLMNSLAFAEYTAGSGGIPAVLALLGDADQATLSSIRRTRWYPFALHCRLLRAVDMALGTGDLSLLWQLGRFSAGLDMPRLFRPLLRLGRPGWMFDVATRMWRFYHREGVWTIERTPRELVTKLTQFDEADDAFCASLLGYVSAALEMSGANDVEGTHLACKARGAPNCIFTVRWS